MESQRFVLIPRVSGDPALFSFLTPLMTGKLKTFLAPNV